MVMRTKPQCSFIVLALFFITQVAVSAPVITSGNFDSEGNVVIALKDEIAGKIPQVVKIDKTSTKTEALLLPKEFNGKEIRSLILWDKRLIAFVQATIESGGKPEIWQYQNNWKKLHVFDCRDFDQIKISTGKFSLTCYHSLPNGLEKLEEMNFALKGRDSQEILVDFSRQEFQDAKARQVLSLKGELYQWQEVVIRPIDQKSGKTLTATQLFR
jgi:hypothetical protein